MGDIIPIKTLIDRGYPQYDSPADLKEKYGITFSNYLKFIKEKQSTDDLKVEAMIPGRNDQIVLKGNPDAYPDFSVRNVKANGTIWPGEGIKTFEYLSPEEIIDDKGHFNENPLSLALTHSYGSFSNFTGGDMTGLQGFGLKPWFDVETPVANVVGRWMSLP